MLSHTFQKGINLGGWLSQYEFLACRPLTEEHLNAHFDSFITEKDIRQIAEWGFDHVRLPFSGYLLCGSPAGEINGQSTAARNHIFERLNISPLHYIEKCIAWCKIYHLNMILDLHDFQGNVYGAMDKPMPLLIKTSLSDAFVAVWSALAEHFKGHNEIVIAFELLNEVSDASHYLWNHLYKSAVTAIRETDKTRPVLIGSNCQNSVAYLDQLDLLDDPYVFYNFHYYEPQVFTHQKAHFSEELQDYGQTVTYPGDISDFCQYLKRRPEYLMKYFLVSEEKTNDRSLMEKLLLHAVKFVKYSGCCLYCGELGVIDSAPPEEAVKWLKDLFAILDKNQIGHALWNYKALDFGLLNLKGNIVSDTILDFILEYNKTDNPF